MNPQWRGRWFSQCVERTGRHLDGPLLCDTARVEPLHVTSRTTPQPRQAMRTRCMRANRREDERKMHRQTTSHDSIDRKFSAERRPEDDSTHTGR